ncbi:MAG: protein-L-isoaspartate(D-aspartate) O-methyltransferase [Rubrivivax sp.]|nr:protein-L-isoaspartate(D-aspartate) O-methyltransferase [Rubrivivax sp.]
MVETQLSAPGRGITNARVLAVMEKVPRHEFVPQPLRSQAYDDYPLPIGHGQTISQPYIVALMTDLLHLRPGDRVLEIGTGSGYQAAVLAELGARVHSIEIIEPLARWAARNLKGAGYGQVQLRVGDGYYGWPEAAPFDAIIVTAAASHVPPPLVKQLKAGGRMVIPVGTAFLTQHLMLVEKQADGGVTTRQILPVRFVPLTGGH